MTKSLLRILAGVCAIALLVGVIWQANQPSDAESPIPTQSASSPDVQPPVEAFPGQPGVDAPTTAHQTSDAATAAPDNPDADTTASTDARSALEADDPNPRFATVGDRIEAMRARRPGLDVDPEKVRDAIQKEKLWETSRTAPQDLPLSEKEMYDGRVFVSSDALRVESLMPGDTLSIEIPQTGETHQLVIQSVEEANGTLTWKGYVADFEADNFFTLTKGARMMSGAITTPSNDYAFEIFGDQGWITDRSSLFTDEAEPIVPPIEEEQ